MERPTVGRSGSDFGNGLVDLAHTYLLRLPARLDVICGRAREGPPLEDQTVNVSLCRRGRLVRQSVSAGDGDCQCQPTASCPSCGDSGQGSHEGHHHFIPGGLIASVEGNKVRLSANGDVAVTFEEEA